LTSIPSFSSTWLLEWRGIRDSNRQAPPRERKILASVNDALADASPQACHRPDRPDSVRRRLFRRLRDGRFGPVDSLQCLLSWETWCEGPSPAFLRAGGGRRLLRRNTRGWPQRRWAAGPSPTPRTGVKGAALRTAFRPLKTAFEAVITLDGRRPARIQRTSPFSWRSLSQDERRPHSSVPGTEGFRPCPAGQPVRQPFFLPRPFLLLGSRPFRIPRRIPPLFHALPPRKGRCAAMPTTPRWNCCSGPAAGA